MITPERIENALRLADATLRAMGCDPPRIGVAALNPHCGENGLFGDEEIRIIRPTLDKLDAGGHQQPPGRSRRTQFFCGRDAGSSMGS